MPWIKVMERKKKKHSAIRLKHMLIIVFFALVVGKLAVFMVTTIQRDPLKKKSISVTQVMVNPNKENIADFKEQYKDQIASLDQSTIDELKKKYSDYIPK